MGYGAKCFNRVETTKMLWLTGAILALIIVFQCIELPYGKVLSSVFSSGEVPASESEKVADVANPNGLDSIRVRASNKTGNHTLISEGKESDLNNDIVSQNNVSLNASSGFDGVGRPSNESSTEKLESRNSSGNKTEAEGVGIQGSFALENKTMNAEANMTLVSENAENFNAGVGSPLPSLPPRDLLTGKDLGKNEDANIQNSVTSSNSTLSSEEKSLTSSLDDDESLVQGLENLNQPGNLNLTSVPEMNKLLRENRVSFHSVTPRWSSAGDQELLQARLQIENAPLVKNDVELYAPLYRNLSMLKRSYELMEEKLKVYIYKEGKKPILHAPSVKGIYASEGLFMKLLESNKKFVTKNPKEAHLFYLPFSSKMLQRTLYVEDSHSVKNLVQFLKSYVDLIASKYPFWNRTQGADHFLVACHDWAPQETREYMGNCIKALCNADMKQGYIFGKDVSLPETRVHSPQHLTRDLGGKPPLERSILAFFAGKMHGYLRPVLLQHWGKDPDMRIFSRMPRVISLNYAQHMKTSKYCLCPRGYEVNSPRVVEAVFYECVPVIISDNFIPPFFEILNWESFAVFVAEKDVPNLKNILLSIPQKRYVQMQQSVKKASTQSSDVKKDIISSSNSGSSSLLSGFKGRPRFNICKIKYFESI